MRTYLAFIITALTLASCGIEDAGTGRRPTSGDNWKNPSFSIDSSANARKVCYMTGLDYPRDYDWQNDAENGTVKCSLVVFADGVPAMKIPVGNEYHVSPDPDMHRIIRGHLYTDFSTDAETVIKKDGREIFRYEGREMILGMEVCNGDVYTLGRPREGSGFAFRKNGERLIHRENGQVFPRLQNDGDSLSFSFCERIASNSGNIDRYYHVYNGNIRQVAVREDIRKVWDIIRHGNEVCYIAELTGIGAPVIIKGETMKALDISEGMKTVSCRLIPAGRSVGTEAIFTHNGMYWNSGIWKDGERHMTFTSGLTICGICTDEDGICCILNEGSSSGGGLIFRCGETLDIPDGYTCIGSSPIAMMDGILTVGLTSVLGGKPVIWKDGKTLEVDINGCICTLTVQ